MPADNRFFRTFLRKGNICGSEPENFVFFLIISIPVGIYSPVDIMEVLVRMNEGELIEPVHMVFKFGTDFGIKKNLSGKFFVFFCLVIITKHILVIALEGDDFVWAIAFLKFFDVGNNLFNVRSPIGKVAKED